AGGAGADGEGFSDEDLALSGKQWGNGNIPEAQADGLFKDLHFAYDSSAITEEHRQELRANAEILVGDPSIHAEIEGHCDKRGTNEYNLALGEERAKAVASILVSYGVSPSQLSTISYGEEIPIDPGNSETAFAQNRRVHFALFRDNQGNQRR
ncbi:hypothetical protein BVY02_02350, partial [bacterium J17]